MIFRDLFLFVLGASALANAPTQAQDALQAQKTAIQVITDTADKICNQAPPLVGSGSNIELSGEAKAALSGAIGRIVDLGIQGAGKYTSDQYSGVLRADLAKTIQENTNCRLVVFNALNEKLLGNPVPHPGTPTVMRFGIRNNGGTYGLAGGDPNLARMVVLPSGTVVVTLKEPIDPKATAVYVEGNTTPLPVTKVTPTSLQFQLPTIEPNGVAVIIINAE
jgi:hypothetical protein